jgi:hypothetical protein
MKKIHLINLILIVGLVSGCAPNKSDDMVVKPDLKEIIGSYKLTTEESVKRNETRFWTITKIDDSHVKIKEFLTTDPNSKKPKITSLIFDNVAVIALETSGSVLDFKNSGFEDSDFLVNGHKNYKMLGYGTMQSNVLTARLTLLDLNTKEQIPYGGFLELTKL